MNILSVTAIKLFVFCILLFCTSMASVIRLYKFNIKIILNSSLYFEILNVLQGKSMYNMGVQLHGLPGPHF